MREIKFRVFLNDLSANKGFPIIIEPLEFKSWDKVDLNTLSQYTGLRDKNGKEIYEGDIVKIKVYGKYNIEIISWNDENAEFDYLSSYHNNECGYDKYDCEIIGNIYENKELLDV